MNLQHIQQFTQALPVESLDLILKHPRETLEFANAIDGLNIPKDAIPKLAQITPQQWTQVVIKSLEDPKIVEIAKRSKNGEPPRMSASEQKHVENSTKNTLEFLGILSALGIGLLDVFVGWIMASVGFLVAAGFVAAALGTGGSSLVPAVFSAVVAFVGVFIAFFGIMTLVPSLIGLIAFCIPSKVFVGVESVGTDLFGGAGGSPFIDDVQNVKRVKKVKIRHSDYVLAIHMEWVTKDNHRKMGVPHGGQWKGGKTSEFTLDTDEYITHIKGRSGTLVDSLTFYTNKEIYGPYGGKGGNAFELRPRYGKKILGFQGRGAGAIDAIGVVSELYGSAQYGGQGGVVFLDNLSDVKRIKEINVWHGSYIDAMQLIWETESGELKKGRKHGGSGGNLKKIKLDKDDYITTIHGTSGDYIDSLVIKTKKGQRVALGGKGGNPYKIDIKKDQKILGFWGRSGIYMDAFGVCMTPTVS